VARLEIPMVGGLDESTNRKVLSPPGLRTNLNTRIDERGMSRKRRGTVALASGAVDSGDPIGPVRLTSHKGQVLVCAEDGLWTVAADGARLEELDALPSTTLESVVPLGHYGAANVVASGVAETTAFRVWAWTAFDGTNYRLHIMTLDLARGAGSAATGYYTTTSAGTKCLKVIAIGSKVTVFFGDTTAQLKYVDITSATSGPYSGQTGTVLYSDAIQTSPQWFDVAPHDTGYCLVYRSSSTAYKVKRMSSAHAESATGTFTPGTFGTSPRFAITGNATQIAVAVASDNSTTLSVFWYNNSIVQTATAAFSDSTVWGSTSVDTVGVAIGTYQSTGTLMVALTGINASSKYGFKVGTLTTAGALELTQLKINARVASKPWVYNGEVYTLVSFWAGVQGNSYYAVVGHTGGPIATTALQHPLLEARVRDARATQTPLDDCAACVAQVGSLCAVPIPAVERYSPPGVAVDPTGQTAIDPNQEGALGVQTITLVGVDGFHFDHANRARWQAVTVGDYTCFSGGVIGKFDGRRRTEIGFPSFPYSPGTVSSGAGGIEAGTFVCAVCWEWTDFLGNREQSAAYLARDLVIDATDDRIISQADIPAFHQKHWLLPGTDNHNVVLAVYRTTADGTLLFRVEGGAAELFDEATGSNTFSVATYTDNNTSASMTLDARELLYTTDLGANELQHQMPPPSNVICGHENRLFFVSAEDPTLVGYTLQQFTGQSLAWNASLSIKFDVPVVAMASQDGNLVAFGERTIYTLTGRPSDDNTGRSTGYDPPQLLSSHTGCVSRRSVLTSPVGTWFQSARGLELLPRGGGGSEFAGEKVRSTLAAFPIITDALHVPKRSEVLFSCVDVESVAGVGRVLVFDYRNKIWAVRNYQNEPIACMTLDGEDVVFGIYNSADGLTLWQEDDGHDDADGSFVAREYEFGDVRFAGNAGGQRMLTATLMGEVAAAVRVQVGETVDSGASYMYRQPTRETATQQWLKEYSFFQTKANAHGLRIIESQGDGVSADSAGFALASIRFDGQPFGNSARLAGRQRV
jgi:hypothetical protein